MKLTLFEEDATKNLPTTDVIFTGNDTFNEISPDSTEITTNHNFKTELQTVDDEDLWKYGSQNSDSRTCESVSQSEELLQRNGFRYGEGRMQVNGLEPLKVNFLEDKNAEDFVRQADGFYVEMMERINQLKRCSLNNKEQLYDEVGDGWDEKIYGGLNSFEEEERSFIKKTRNIFRSTPDLTTHLETIQKLDTQLYNAASDLAKERGLRLEVQDELCASLSDETEARSNLDKDAELFLQLCSLDQRDKEDTKELEEQSREDNNRERRRRKEGGKGEGRDWIMRNVELAKEGWLANCSLTDEEKQKLEYILSDLKYINVNEEEDILHDNNKYGFPDGQKCLTYPSFVNNAFMTNEDQQVQLKEIDQKLCELHEKPEESPESASGVSDFGSKNWKEYFMGQNLKEINNRINEIEKFCSDSSIRLEVAREKMLREKELIEDDFRRMDENYDYDQNSKFEESDSRNQDNDDDE